MNHVKTSTAFSFAVIIYLLQYNTTVFFVTILPITSQTKHG